MRLPRLLLVPAVALSVLSMGAVARANDLADSPRRPAPAPAPAPFGGLPWLGVSMDNGGDLGVRIESVVRGSPAERGGVRSGDRIVTIDGNRVTAPAHVTRTVAGHKVGEIVTLGIERTGNTISASIVLGTRPSSDDLLRMHLVGALIDFWATWCGPCRMIAPRLSALKDRYGPQGLAVVGITTDEAEQVAVFAERNRMRYPLVIDKNGETSRAYNITGLPTMVLVDKKGVVRDVFIGFDPAGDARLEAAIKKLLAEPAPGAPTPGAPAAIVPAPSVPRPDGR
jgi:thiol-disulfide isomerase/thioredoxin